jgi:23S rRNA pseudouridine1911/1915/1917 synthase
VSDIEKRPGYRVKNGDVISGLIPEPECKEKPVSQSMDLSILFEDDYLLVVDKPAGMVVHPGPGNLCNTLVNGLLDYIPSLQNAGWEPMRPGIVHRLDKDTSGLIVVAKTIKSLLFLQKEFKQRRVKKTYLALVGGKEIADTGEILLPIGRHPVKRKLMAVNHETGKYARTSWQVRQRFANACLVDVRLYTGRTHQIRVHFYAMDMSILGDKVYQPRSIRRKKSIAPRQMLHSCHLRFRHPYSGREMKFEAKMPEDFVQTIVKLGLAN